MNRIFECQVPVPFVEDNLTPGSQFNWGWPYPVSAEDQRHTPLLFLFPWPGHLLRTSHRRDSEVGGDRDQGTERKDDIFP